MAAKKNQKIKTRKKAVSRKLEKVAKRTKIPHCKKCGAVGRNSRTCKKGKHE